MLKAAFLLLPLFILVNSSDCNPQKQDERTRLLEADVRQLKAEVAELKQKAATEHHYELRSEGLRTYRFDPATGETCIALTSKDDWKRKETQASSCRCKDALRHYKEMPKETADERQIAEVELQWLKLDCGQL